MFGLSTIPIRLWSYMIAGAFVVWLLWRIYKAGGDAKEVEGLKKTLNAVIERKEIETEVDAMSDSAVLERLRRNGWYRD